MQPYVHHQPCADRAGLHHRVAPLDVGFPKARQIHRHPLTGKSRLHVLAVDLQVADAGLGAGGGQHRRVVHLHGAFDQRAGDHGAKAVHRENTVHRQTEGSTKILFRRRLDHFPELFPQLGDALAGVGRYGEHRLSFEKGALHPFGDLFVHHFHPFRLHHVGFGDDHQTVPDAQKGQNAQMLDGLRHKAFVGGDH